MVPVIYAPRMKVIPILPVLFPSMRMEFIPFFIIILSITVVIFRKKFQYGTFAYPVRVHFAVSHFAVSSYNNLNPNP